MGATNFVTMYGNADKMSVAQAFGEAQEQARYEYGHAGYTGTIAEVESYRHYPADVDIDDVLDNDQRVDRSTCGYFIDPDNNAFVFFGWASE
tara:strand:- start:3112 stop:3387 length:276 start_codon:yes stop_codon:yes gene_type:complete